ncbi:hypothetical protein, partial [Nitrosomonas communis]|uniref:hypothetical protein n=1 Tax=Nitrosomonas communis TaxID=44574 RepID=UPI003D29E6E9
MMLMVDCFRKKHWQASLVVFINISQGLNLFLTVGLRFYRKWVDMLSHWLQNRYFKDGTQLNKNIPKLKKQIVTGCWKSSGRHEINMDYK